MHQVGVALFGDQFLGGRGFASRVERGTRLRNGLGLENVVFYAVILPQIGKVVLLPNTVEHVKPFAGASVAVVVLLKRHAVLAGFIGPPRGNNIKREPPIADVIDVCGLFRQQRRQMERRPHRYHQFNFFRDSSQRRSRGPSVQRIRFYALDVVQIQLGDKRDVEADLFAALRQPLHIRPACLHVFVFHVAQPSAENRQPISVSHRGPPVEATRSACLASWPCASEIRKSASRA